MPSTSLNDRIVQTGGRSSGFDYLRLILSISVILWHSFGISYGADYEYKILTSPYRPLVSTIMPMFFALSGFLVAGSLHRTKALTTFVGLRVIRIIPALAVEVILSALIIGPLLTTTPISKYFFSSEWLQYFLNIFGDIHYHLPGLFLNNPIPSVVNGQLWSVPWELNCYLALVVLSLFRLSKTPFILGAIVILISLALFTRRALLFHWNFELGYGTLPPLLVLTFLAGVALYNARALVPWESPYAAAAGAAMVALSLIPGGDYFIAFPAAYTTIYLGLLNPKRLIILQGADYSYGLFLYGYVIQQAIAQMGPPTHHWWINFSMTLPVAAAFSAFSWNVVEKPALELRRHLPFIEGLVASLRKTKSPRPQRGVLE